MWLGGQNKKPIPPVVKGRVYARGSTQDSEIVKLNYLTTSLLSPVTERSVYYY